jgi:hypothetical protein
MLLSDAAEVKVYVIVCEVLVLPIFTMPKFTDDGVVCAWVAELKAISNQIQHTSTATPLAGREHVWCSSARDSFLATSRLARRRSGNLVEYEGANLEEGL